MIAIRRSADRGQFDHGWLKTWHTFSFADYRDPDFMGFRTLRVINEDIVAPGQGFGTHPHADMEIITYILDGAIEHKDSMGNGSIIRAGEIQRMTAGTGVTHSEFNPSTDEPLHLLQIWIRPATRGLTPGYEQKSTGIAQRPGTLIRIASQAVDGAGESAGEDGVTIHQDAEIWAARLTSGQEVVHELREGRGVWVQVVRGAAVVSGETLSAGDGGAIELESSVHIASTSTDDTSTEVLVFDLA